jgi:hypothetical protein
MSGSTFMRRCRRKIFIHISLRASPAPSAGPHVGTLLIRAPGYQPLVLKITLAKNVLRPALLIISRKTGQLSSHDPYVRRSRIALGETSSGVNSVQNRRRK